MDTQVVVVMAYNDLAVDNQVVYCRDHIEVESVIADMVGHRGDSMSDAMRL